MYRCQQYSCGFLYWYYDKDGSSNDDDKNTDNRINKINDNNDYNNNKT